MMQAKKIEVIDSKTIKKEDLLYSDIDGKLYIVDGIDLNNLKGLYISGEAYLDMVNWD